MSGTVRCKYQKGIYGVPADNSTLMDDGKYWAPGTRRVIIVRPGHGSDGTGVGPLQGVFGFFEVTRALIDAGFTVFCVDAGGKNNWWSPNGMTAFEAAVNYIKGWAGVSKVAVFGGSMGGGQVIQAAKTPAIATNLCGVAAISASVDLDYVNGTPGYVPAYSYNTAATPTFGGWAGTVLGQDVRAADAYNCTPQNWTTATAGHRIWDEPASWRDLPFPIRLWHGTNDEIVPYAQVQWWIDQVDDANVTLRTLTNAFHTPALPSQNGPLLSEYIDFFNALSWS